MIQMQQMWRKLCVNCKMKVPKYWLLSNNTKRGILFVCFQMLQRMKFCDY